MPDSTLIVGLAGITGTLLSPLVVHRLTAEREADQRTHDVDKQVRQFDHEQKELERTEIRALMDGFAQNLVRETARTDF